MIQYTKAHIADLERAIQELNDKRREFTTKKIEFENSLSNLKTKRNPKRLDRNLENTIENIKSKLNDINSEILKLNTLKSKKAVLKQDIERGLKSGNFVMSMPLEAKQIHQNEDENNLLRLRLLELKDKYLDFSSDHTRVASMRQMSAEFVKELEILIKNKR
jgi:hypothetical protein